MKIIRYILFLFLFAIAGEVLASDTVSHKDSRVECIQLPVEVCDALYVDGTIIYKVARTIYVHSFIRNYSWQIQFDYDIASFNIKQKFKNDLHVTFVGDDAFFQKTYRFPIFNTILFPSVESKIKPIRLHPNVQHSLCASQVDSQVLIVFDTQGLLNKKYVFPYAISTFCFISENEMKVSFEGDHSTHIAIPKRDTSCYQEKSLQLAAIRSRFSNNQIYEVGKTYDMNYWIACSDRCLQVRDKECLQVLYTLKEKKVSFFEIYRGCTKDVHYLVLYIKDDTNDCLTKKLVKIAYGRAYELDLLRLHEGLKYIIAHTQDKKLVLFDIFKKRELAIKHNIYARKKVKSFSLLKNDDGKDVYIKMALSDILVLFDIERQHLHVISDSYTHCIAKRYCVYRDFDGTILLQDRETQKILSYVSSIINRKKNIQKSSFFYDAITQNPYYVADCFDNSKLLVNIKTGSFLDVSLQKNKRQKNLLLYVLGENGLMIANAETKKSVIIRANKSIEDAWAIRADDGAVYITIQEKENTLVRVYKTNGPLDEIKELKVVEAKKWGGVFCYKMDDKSCLLFDVSLRPINVLTQVFSIKTYKSCFYMLRSDSCNIYFDTKRLRCFSVAQILKAKEGDRYLWVYVRDNKTMKSYLKVLDRKDGNNEVLEIVGSEHLDVIKLVCLQKNNNVYIIVKDINFIPKSIKHSTRLESLPEGRFTFLDAEGRDVFGVRMFYTGVFSTYEFGSLRGIKIVLPNTLQEAMTPEVARTMCDGYQETIKSIVVKQKTPVSSSQDKESPRRTGKKRKRSEYEMESQPQPNSGANLKTVEQQKKNIVPLPLPPPPTSSLQMLQRSLCVPPMVNNASMTPNMGGAPRVPHQPIPIIPSLSHLPVNVYLQLFANNVVINQNIGTASSQHMQKPLPLIQPPNVALGVPKPSSGSFQVSRQRPLPPIQPPNVALGMPKGQTGSFQVPPSSQYMQKPLPLIQPPNVALGVPKPSSGSFQVPRSGQHMQRPLPPSRPNIVLKSPKITQKQQLQISLLQNMSRFTSPQKKVSSQNVLLNDTKERVPKVKKLQNQQKISPVAGLLPKISKSKKALPILSRRSPVQQQQPLQRLVTQQQVSQHQRNRGSQEQQVRQPSSLLQQHQHLMKTNPAYAQRYNNMISRRSVSYLPQVPVAYQAKSLEPPKKKRKLTIDDKKIEGK